MKTYFSLSSFLLKVWLGRKDSNPRMPESKSGALTNLATPHNFFLEIKNILIKFFILNKFTYFSNFFFTCDRTEGYKNSETSPPRTAISLTIVPDIN